MTSEDLVFEFFVKSISCRNVKSKSSPLVIEINGCAELIFSPKTTTICKITYNRGKRIIFNQTNFTNIKTTFTLQQGHGDTSVRASSTFDFYEIFQANNDLTPTVYNVEAGLDDPNGNRFGTLELSFQIFPYSELEDIQKSFTIIKTSTRPLTSRTATGRTTKFNVTGNTTSRTTVRSVANVTPRQPEPGAPTVPRLNIPTTPLSSRSCSSSIHERYMKRNEMWLGHHCSTRCDEPPSTRTSSRSSTRSVRSNYVYSK